MGSGLGLLHVYAFTANQTVPNMKTTVFLDVTLYSLVCKCRRFRGTCYVYPHDRRTCSGRRTFFFHKDAAEYYSKIWYLSNRLPGNIYRKRVIIIITTARTSNITRMDMYSVNRAPSCHPAHWQIFNDYGTQSMWKPEQECEDKM